MNHRPLTRRRLLHAGSLSCLTAGLSQVMRLRAAAGFLLLIGTDCNLRVLRHAQRSRVHVLPTQDRYAPLVRLLNNALFVGYSRFSTNLLVLSGVIPLRR